ncbi:MAG: biopolymer transporter ExbD [Gemmatimonadaceae bacterium]|nr:biopolymer transporter ExbD [Gemmatimonadaceae bacterium]
MGMAVSTGGGVKAEPNVTPMIDVMLVLLIIFMIVVPAINAGFNATPPQGVNLKTRPEEPGEILLGIDSKGALYLDKREITAEALPGKLKEIYDARTVDKIIYLKAHGAIEYGKVQDALDIAGKAGVRMTGMISDQRPGTESSVAGDKNAPGTEGAAPVKPPEE